MTEIVHRMFNEMLKATVSDFNIKWTASTAPVLRSDSNS